MTTTSSVRSRFRAVLPACMAILGSAVTAVSVDAATITVNSFNQIDPGQCTIATAISSMNAGADQVGCTHAGAYGTSDTIVLAAGTYALTTANNGTNAYPIIQKAVAVNGNGATLSRTVGNVAPFFRFFEVQAGGLTINNVTLTGGNVPSGTGGAILSRSGPLTVSGATFSGNSASSGVGGAIQHRSIEAASISNTTFTNNTVSPAGNGGAIFDSSSNGMTLANTTFSGNSAGAGVGGAIFDSSIGGLTITNGTFSGNSVTAGNGGAIFDSSTGGLVFNGGSVTNNSSAGGNGGGIFDSSSGGLNITNVVFTGNTAAVDGGAIFDASSVGTGPVSNNCFVGNTATISGGGIFRISTPALNAINNWWGAASGPSGAGPGTGDAVSTNVTFAPFLVSPPGICAGPSAGTLQFSAPTYSVNEGAGSATITVTRVGGSTGAVGVSFATSNGTATAGSDYTTSTGTLSWADGDATAKTFVVPIIDDTLVEGNETVNLTLSAPTGGATLGAQATAVLTIVDNDAALAPNVPIPTLSEWALWTMTLLLLAAGMWAMRRHHR